MKFNPGKRCATCKRGRDKVDIAFKQAHCVECYREYRARYREQVRERDRVVMERIRREARV